ncbi:GNAT family N-acetyltransferase, partial [Acinetobacter baumannii]
VVVRDFSLADAESLALNANDKDVSLNLRDAFPFPYTITDAQDWIALVTSMHPSTNFALDVDGKAVGGIGLKMQEDVHRRSAEIGYWLG